MCCFFNWTNMSLFLNFSFILIIGGFHQVSARYGQPIEYRPYQAFITCHPSGSKGAGAFITRRHVATVAQLVQLYSKWTIGYGSSIYNELITVETNIGILHPEFNANWRPYNDDVAIIVLPQDVMSPLVKPITLPSSIDGLLFPRINEEGAVASFNFNFTNGTANQNPTLHVAYLMVQPVNRCVLSDIESFLPFGKFCASNEFIDENICSSVGTPFIVRQRGEDVLAGFLNYYDQYCNEGTVSNYIRFQEYLDWFELIAL